VVHLLVLHVPVVDDRPPPTMLFRSAWLSVFTDFTFNDNFFWLLFAFIVRPFLVRRRWFVLQPFGQFRSGGTYENNMRSETCDTLV
jgi:hypothetical protein